MNDRDLIESFTDDEERVFAEWYRDWWEENAAPKETLTVLYYLKEFVWPR